MARTACERAGHPCLWPAEYDHLGITTFLVSHQGTVYEKDLGPETAEIAVAIDAYDPDATWTQWPTDAADGGQRSPSAHGSGTDR